jgi:hypothetical protein
MPDWLESFFWMAWHVAVGLLELPEKVAATVDGASTERRRAPRKTIVQLQPTAVSV